jgi:hypothetical protein
MLTDRIDKMLTVAWGVLGGVLLLKPAGYVGWTDLALWTGAAWLVVLLGMWYLSAAKARR